MREKLLTQKRLKELFEYNHLSGVFTWIIRPARCVKIGDIAGTDNGKGYLRVKIDGKNYRLHRLAWLYFYGELPVGDIDHINGNKKDNRIENLRDVSKSENMQNQKKAHLNNKTTGLLGVCKHKITNKYVASIRHNKRLIHIGSYDSPEEAHRAYINKKREIHTASVL
jgi:hypothetical protein